MWKRRVGMPVWMGRALVFSVAVDAFAADGFAGAASAGDASAPTAGPAQRYPAPAWIDARLPAGKMAIGPHFLVALQTSHVRVLRDGKPWFNPADHLPGASIVRAEPVGDDAAVLSLYVGPNRPYAVVRYRAGGPLVPLADSQVAAVVRKGRSLLFVRGSTLVERDLDGQVEQLRARFSPQEVVERIEVFGDRVLVLLQRRNSTRDVLSVGSTEPLVTGIDFGSSTPDGWVVNQGGRNLIVGAEGSPRPLPPGSKLQIIDTVRPPLSFEERLGSAVVAIGTDGAMSRRTPWVVNVEGYDVHRALRGEVLPAHRLQVVRSVDGESAIWRESESDPWRLLDGLTTPWGTSAIAASEFSLQGNNLVARQGDGLRWFHGTSQTLLVPRGAKTLRLAGDILRWQTVDHLWTQVRLDESTAAATSDPQVVHHAGRALRVSRGEGLALDGRPLPYRFPTDMRGHFGVVVDGAYPVEGTSYVLLVVGRQSAHGGHFVFDRVLAVDVRDGSVARVGPDGAWPMGFDTRSNYGRFATLAASSRGLWMHVGRDLFLVPLAGQPAQKVGTLDEVDSQQGMAAWPRRATVSPDNQRIAFVQEGRLVLWDAERAAVIARTPVLRSPSWTWGPRGHALALVSGKESFALGEDGALQRLGCAVAEGGSQSRLLDVLPEAGAALVCVDGNLAVSRPDRCVRLAELSCYQAIPIAWAATRR